MVLREVDDDDLTVAPHPRRLVSVFYDVLDDCRLPCRCSNRVYTSWGTTNSISTSLGGRPAVLFPRDLTTMTWSLVFVLS